MSLPRQFVVPGAELHLTRDRYPSDPASKRHGVDAEAQGRQRFLSHPSAGIPAQGAASGDEKGNAKARHSVFAKRAIVVRLWLGAAGARFSLGCSANTKFEVLCYRLADE